MDVVQNINEEKIMAVLRNGHNFPIYKNPTPEEINIVGMNGIVRGVLTPSSLIAYDFRNVDLRDLPPINGYSVTIYFLKGESIIIEMNPSVNLSEKEFNQLVERNLYLKRFDIKKVIWKRDET